MSQRNPQNERYTAPREGRSPGATKPHAGAAKPASKAGASVRIESPKKNLTRRQKATAEMTMSKDEKRAKRAKERELENLVYTATAELTNKDEKYKKLRRTWWLLLIMAVVFTALSWATLAVNANTILSGVVLVLAYVGIIGALIMDFTVIRKRRNVFRDKVNAMSRKQVERIVEDSQVERVAKDAGKKAKKEAKKAGASAVEQKAAYDAAFNATMKKTSFKVITDAQEAQEAREAKAAGKKGKKGGTAGDGAQASGNASAAGAGDAAAAGGTGSAGADDEAAAAEAARKAAAAKAAREFAASKGHM